MTTEEKGDLVGMSILTVVIYLVGVFIAWDWNPAGWMTVGRVLASIIWIVLMFVVIPSSEQKEEGPPKPFNIADNKRSVSDLFNSKLRGK